MLDLLDRLLPRLGGYPLWARSLFVATIILVLASGGTYALYFNDASAKQDAAHIAIAVTPNVLTEKAATNAAEVTGLPPSGNAFDGHLEYTDVHTGGHAHFVPRQDYLTAVRAGGPVKALSGLSPLPWDAATRPAVLDVKVTNNTQRTLLFSEAIIDVRRSTPDRRPVLVPMVLLDRPRRLTVLNYGWGPAKDVRVTAGFPMTGNGDVGSTTVRLGTIDRKGEADLSRVFGTAGLDVQALRRWETASPASPATYGVELERVRAVLAPFGLDPERDVEVPVEGALHYRTTAREAPASLRFTATIPATRPMGLGDYQPPTARYETTRLAISGTNYQRRVPLSQRLRPGETDRFEIPVSAAESSEHRFRVRLSYGRGEAVASEPITLDVLVPRQPA